LDESLLSRIIDVSLVHDNDALEVSQYGFHVFPMERIAGRVVRRTEKNHLRPRVDLFGNSVEIQLKITAKIYLTNGDVVDLSRNFVHTIGRRDQNHIVPTWFAECTKQQIDGLVASVAQKNMLGRN